jgi:hypothetical protein
MSPPSSRSKNKSRKNQHDAGRKQISAWRRHDPPKRRFTFNRLHSFISQKMANLLNRRRENLKAYIPLKSVFIFQ